MGAFVGLILILLVVAAYFLPTLVAWQRKHNVSGVLIVNFLVGWTMIGWIIALVMACGTDKTQNITVINQAPGAPAPLFDPRTGERLAPAATPASTAPAAVASEPVTLDAVTEGAPTLPPAPEAPAP